MFDYLDNFCTAYIDDILIYSDNPLEHEEQVCKVLERLRQAGLQVDIKKSEFSVTSTKFLVFIISTEGVAMDPDDTWYDADSFINSASKVKEFHGTYPDEAGPPVRLAKWLEAAQKNENLQPSSNA